MVYEQAVMARRCESCGSGPLYRLRLLRVEQFTEAGSRARGVADLVASDAGHAKGLGCCRVVRRSVALHSFRAAGVAVLDAADGFVNRGFGRPKIAWKLGRHLWDIHACKSSRSRRTFGRLCFADGRLRALFCSLASRPVKPENLSLARSLDRLRRLRSFELGRCRRRQVGNTGRNTRSRDNAAAREKLRVRSLRRRNLRRSFWGVRESNGSRYCEPTLGHHAAARGCRSRSDVRTAVLNL